ncbi:amidohydrolase family protein [Candidatus Chloroploca sp. Khr17]|uniref:amidohydrolase family protein n=1 Tax=Candidatus Chloroploca sp. Khr17 TaxID=2496869 RepID=UPI00101D89A9|nr:amidohydrolase [Candidatus Chloroploca sp. Khr17]
MYDLLVINADILQIEGPSASFLPRHALAITDGRIAAIAPTISPGLAREVLDAQGKLAIPGLINAHAHTAMSLLRGVAEDVAVESWFNDYIWPMEMNLSAEDVYWGSLLGFAEMIEAGVTCVADHYFAMDEVARAVDVAGMRAYLAQVFFSGPQENDQLATSLAFAKRWQGSAAGRITTGLGPHSPYTCTPALLQRTAEVARQHGLGVHLHLAETAGQVAQSLAHHGKTPVALVRDTGLFEVPTLAAHLAHPTQEDLAILAAADVRVVSTPKTELKMALGVTPVVQMRQLGLTVGLGSDGAASNNSYDLLEAARLIALLEKHTRRDAQILPLGEVLALATREGAHALGLAGVTGELRVGYQADVVLIGHDAPHLQPMHNPAATLLYSARATDVDTVIVAGRILMQGRQLRTIDRQRVIEEVRQRAGHMVIRQANAQVAHYPTE